MPETISPRDVAGEGQRDFRVAMMHHPSLHSPDLDEMAGWFERVFGATSKSIAEVLDRVPHVVSYWPRDYLIYTLIRDVFFGSVNPARFVDENGVPHHPQVKEPHLVDLSWTVEAAPEAYRKLRRHGYKITNSIGEVQEGDEPTGPNDPAPFFTQPDETGLRYHFYPGGPFPVDPRSQPGWVLPPVSADDPLALERCSHHTILTKQPERALTLYVDELEAEIVHEGRNELLGAASTYVHTGGTTLEFAVPDSGTDADRLWATNEPKDTYYALTWKTLDLERAERHLESQGVRIRSRSDDLIVTDPETSMGVPWGFSTRLISGDPRSTD
jgi:catechol 2,3-dioxygenase-like lactoylglutathione lyase family enzyme